MKDGSLLMNSWASGNCFSNTNLQNGINALLKIVDDFLSKSSNIVSYVSFDNIQILLACDTH